ncbi:MAG: putative diflavin flavoprotein A 3 [Candidatus Marinimicrobia bacterium]|nr:putative diflavin flavoprotein A 3 [Candidatus Neomarinimicrobiota bacterium]
MDAADSKKVLKMIPYGMFVCTTKSHDEIAASTVTWVTQCSFKPPLLTVAIKADTKIYDILKAAGRFALHVVPAGEKKLASRFFRPATVEESRINGVPFTMDNEYDLPILDSTPAHLICEIKRIPEIGDHHLFIAEIVDAVFRKEMESLLLQDTGWRYSG